MKSVEKVVDIAFTSKAASISTMSPIILVEHNHLEATQCLQSPTLLPSPISETLIFDDNISVSNILSPTLKLMNSSVQKFPSTNFTVPPIIPNRVYTHTIIDSSHFRRRGGVTQIAMPTTSKSSHCKSTIVDNCTDITMVTQLTIDRLLFLKMIIARWHGKICLVLCLSGVQYHQFITDPSRIVSFHIPKRVVIIPYRISRGQSFPVNTLRNLAIRNVTTSHFFYNDIDFLPSYNLYEELMKIPDEMMKLSRIAVIVPAFELLPKTVFNTRDMEVIIKKYYDLIPDTKESLVKCMNTRLKRCTIFRDKSHLHDYLISEWFDTKQSSMLYRIPCLNGDRQEPYLLVKKTLDMPYYDERFTGYGFNKVQWIENLRYVGYRFYVFNNGFIIHCPHPPYIWMSNISFRSESQRMFGVKMRKIVSLWNTFLNELRTKRKRYIRTPYC